MSTDDVTHPDRDSFASLVADVAAALDETIPPWRVRLSAAAVEWRTLGIDASIIERAAALPAEPDTDALLATFARAVRQLAALESEAVTFDPAFAGDAVFRDPTRVRDAAALVAEQRARGTREASRTAYPNGEHWVLRWPAIGDLLAGELA